MKKILISAIFFSLVLQGYSQQITGTVYDKFTRMELGGARVFFEGSCIETLSDRMGNFKLQPPEGQRLPVVATFPGYKPLLVLEYPVNAHIHFFMDKGMYALQNEISSRKMIQRSSRQAYLEIFREQFLGGSLNGRSCRILNEKNLVFKYNPRSDLLTVTAAEPLKIDNNTLGYRISYYLEKFEYSSTTGILQYTGCSKYNEHSLSETGRKSVERERERAYFGSWMELFRSLWNNALDSAGYELKNESNEKLTFDSLVLEIKGSKYWKYKGPVSIYHYSRTPSATIQAGELIYFDKLGYFDTRGVDWKWSGEMTLQRVGDQLPYDYKMNHNNPTSNSQ